MPFRVITLAHEIYTVEDDDGVNLLVELSGRIRYSGDLWPAVGDYVEVRGGAVIDRVLPRTNVISRKQAGDNYEAQILAANVDVIFIVCGLDGDFNPRRIERYLTLAAESAANAVIVLNKADLAPSIDPYIHQLPKNVPVLAISARQGHHVDQLNRHVAPTQTAVLLGSSGAGKSTIANALLGRTAQATRSVRDSDSRGRHTTTQRQLIRMPAGWFLIDTPGLREVQLWAGADSVDSAFDEIAELSSGCQFRDCTHTGEPGCAVIHASEDGTLDSARLESFQKLRREVAFLERKTDERTNSEYKRWMKNLTKQIRNHPKYKRDHPG